MAKKSLMKVIVVVEATSSLAYDLESQATLLDFQSRIGLAEKPLFSQQATKDSGIGVLDSLQKR